MNKRKTGRNTAKKTAARRGKTVSKAAVKRASSVRKEAVKKSGKRVLSEKARLARNKRTVLAFYEAAINQKDFDAARKYMGETYTQHNPTAADGPEGLRDWLVEFKRAYPDLRAEIKRVVAEGDYVVLHVYGVNGPSANGTAVVDIFRLKDGKVVEHWDVIQDIPPEVENSNSMF
jgi:predicted SnoaL-like aldol condensation-catalyzing enzyme